MNRKGGNIMLCRDIMETDVECVSARTPIKEVARKMRDRNVGFAPVCDENWRVLGTITDRDIAIRMVAEELSPNTPVDALMTHEVIACQPEDDLDYARDLMAEAHKSRIMCIGSDGRIAGVISLSDIAQIDDSSGAATLRRVARRETRADGGLHLSAR